MPKYRKRPVVIEAVGASVVLRCAEGNWKGLPEWLKVAYERGDVLFLNNPRRVDIRTLEGTMTASMDDWILRGVKGEIYPCRNDIFEATYEIAEEDSPYKDDRVAKSSTLEAISVEVVRARTKFPSNAKMLAALVEEVGELAQALLQRKSLSDIRKEATQVACVAVRIIEEGDSDFERGEWGDAP